MSKDERPRWRVNEKSFIGHSQVEEGTEVFYTPGEGCEVAANLTPLNDHAQAIVDGQKGEHPDKTATIKAGKGRPAPVPVVEADEDGPVKAPKGSTKAEKPARGGKAKAEQPAEPDDEDVG